MAHRLHVALLSSTLALMVISRPVFGQEPTFADPASALDGPIKTLNLDNVTLFTLDNSEVPDAANDSSSSGQPETGGVVHRAMARTLKDQKGLYRAPFQRSNLKWDLLVLAGTGALIATDRHIERHLPGGDVNIYGNASNIALGGTSATLALLWGYGMKSHNEHLKELGSLEIEALVNTFLIYTPMQFVAGRQRPGEGNGYGDFWKHHNINTSFPGGHAMFTFTMASVAAHEYPKPWVKALAYTAATAVLAGRFLGRDHWSSDMFVGSTLGYLIGAHIFHSRCDPQLSEACH